MSCWQFPKELGLPVTQVPPVSHTLLLNIRFFWLVKNQTPIDQQKSYVMKALDIPFYRFNTGITTHAGCWKTLEKFVNHLLLVIYKRFSSLLTSRVNYYAVKPIETVSFCDAEQNRKTIPTHFMKQ